MFQCLMHFAEGLTDKADPKRMIATATLSERWHLSQIAAQTSISWQLVDE